MKKRNGLIFTTLFAGVLAVGVITTANKATEVNAGTQNRTIVEDTFNNSSFKGKINTAFWKESEGNKIAQSTTGSCYLKAAGGNQNVESYVFSTAKKLTNIVSFKFDFMYCANAEGTGKWFSPYFVNEEQDFFAKDAEFEDSTAYLGVGRFMENAYIGTNGITHKTMKVVDGPNYIYKDRNNVEKKAIKVWYTFEMVITSKKDYTVSIYEQGTTPLGAPSTYVYNVTNYDLQNAYIGLAVSNESGDIEFDNVVINYNSCEKVEDFSDCNLFSEDRFFKIIPNAKNQSLDETKSKFSVIDDCDLTFEQAEVNDYIYTKNIVEDETCGIETINVIDLSLQVQIDGDAKIAIVFGVNKDQIDFKKSTLVYEINTDGGTLIEYDENGEVLTSNENDLSFVGTKSILSISYNKKNGITIRENGVKVKKNAAEVAFPRVDNVFGAIAVTYLNKATTGKCLVDEFVAKSTSYYKPLTKSVTHDFSSDFWGNDGYKDFIAMNITNNKEKYVQDGKLTFRRAADTTFFGSAHQYDDFVMDFKLCSIYGDLNSKDTTEKTAAEKWIGLDLSRSISDYNSYGSYATFTTVITPTAESTWRQGVYCRPGISPVTASDIQMVKYEDIPLSLFHNITYSQISEKGNIKEADAVCFRYVSQNGNLSLYLKKASEIEYTKYYSLKNIKLQGYFALTCTGYLYADIDDFSMSNTSSVFDVASNQSPETQIEIVTKTIYDNQSNEINLEEEIKINSGSNGTIIAIAVGGSVAAVLAGCLVFFIIKGKKKGIK